MKFLVFPEIRQTHDYDCGAKAIESVLAYYGFDISESEIIKISGTKKTGTSPRGIIKTFKKFGLKCREDQLTINQIKKYINKKIPVILLLQAWANRKDINWERDWADGHYVVVIGYDRKKLYFEDPASVLRTYLTYRELEKRWHDKDNKGRKYIHYGIAVYGKKNVFSFKKKIHMN